MPDVEKVVNALEWLLENMVDTFNDFMLFDYDGPIVLANKPIIEDALALLKAQEPCKDAVSRKDVINVLQSPCDMRYVNGNWHPCIGDYIEAITNLSAVAPKAQEPKAVIGVTEIYKDIWLGNCPSCDQSIVNNINKSTKYCRFCGQAVKWE